MTDSDSSEAKPVPADPQSLPLEELEFTPQWVKTAGKTYTEHAGAESERRREERRPKRERERRRDRPPDRDRRSERPTVAPDRRPEHRPAGPQRRPGKDHRPPPQPPLTLPVEVVFQPEEKGFAAMMQTMKQAPRAYALFDVAKLVLNKPERHHVRFVHKPGTDGSRPPLFVVLATEDVFLREDEALRFALRHEAAKIHREKKTPIEPPKGNFTFVNRCGISGVWLGPPNYHEYQSRLIRHHQQRLRHMPFEEFRSRIQTVRDPEAIKAWLDSMSFKIEYECLLDSEPKAFATRDELEKHLYEAHRAQFVATVPEARISGMASRQLHNPALLETLRLAWLQERKFPLNTANEIRGKLRHEGFHFFKDPKGITYISPVKPQRFDAISHLSEQIQRIIVFLREHFGCKRKELLAHFIPAAERAAVSPSPTPSATPEPSPAGATTPPVASPSTTEERILVDLHWLIHDGYVVEFSDGKLWALPDKPLQPPPAPKPAAPVAAESSTTPTEGNTASTAAPPAASEPVTTPTEASAAASDAPAAAPSAPAPNEPSPVVASTPAPVETPPPGESSPNTSNDSAGSNPPDSVP